MQSIPTNIFSILRRFTVILLVLLFVTIPAFAQKKDTIKTDTAYLTPEQTRLIVPPQRYLFSPQSDLMVGVSRVSKGDLSGVGFSAIAKGVYQISGLLQFNTGLGYTRLNSRSRATNNNTDTLHWADIIVLPIGLSFVIGDDRSQVITTVDLLPCHYAGNSGAYFGQRKFGWGVSTEFGFMVRVRTYWHLGLIGKLQVFQHFDRDKGNWPQYGFAGVGPTIRFTY